ncbi:MAG: hypothetical protein ACLFRU_07435 [Paracoccaceae bacterium]
MNVAAIEGKGKGRGKGRGKGPGKAMRRGRKMRQAGASKVAFHLEPEVQELCRAEAEKAGMETGHFLQKVVETWLLENAAPESALAERLAAKRAVIDRAIALAREVDAEGGFDEHFILTVMRRAMADDAFRTLYETAVGAQAEETGVSAKTPLNQQLGRLIKAAVGARPRLDESGKAVRAQVTGEAIQSYSLLEKAA